MRFAQLYNETIAKLTRAGIETAETEALLLLEYVFGLTRSRLFLCGDREVPADGMERFNAVLARRLTREPLHYITGTREFWSLDFVVSPAVLVPRPETEFVLDTVLATVRKQGYHHGPILDMCTGSGVMAVVLARELGGGNVVAVDSSVEALLIASQNIRRFGLENAISLVCADLFTALCRDMRYEIIVANPPYIAEDVVACLQLEVSEWEPRSALSGGAQGMDVINRIVEQAYRYLVPGGWLFVEMGADQEEKVYELFKGEAGNAYGKPVVLADWSGRPRLLQVGKREVGV